MPESLDIIKRIDDDSKLEIIQNRRESLFEGGLEGQRIQNKGPTSYQGPQGVIEGHSSASKGPLLDHIAGPWYRVLSGQILSPGSGKRLQGCMLNDKRHLHENIYQTPRSCICT